MAGNYSQLLKSHELISFVYINKIICLDYETVIRIYQKLLGGFCFLLYLDL